MNGRTSEAAFSIQRSAFSIQRSAFSVRGSSFILHPSSFRYAAGFSLVEVCLALLVVGLGLLAIIGLFPGGLRSSENAEADTYVSLSAEAIMGGIRANASTISDWTVWNTDGQFTNAVLAGLGVGQTGLGTPTPAAYTNSGGYVRYRLDVLVTNAALSRCWRGVTLQLCYGQYGSFSRYDTFSTELYFRGM
jgi:type IV pilus modification protein PilV